MNVWEELKAKFKRGDYLTRIILINLLVFLLVILYRVVLFLFQFDSDTYSLTNIFAVPAEFQRLFLKPWTLITSMFFHEKFFHLAFNMLWLYWFGKMFSTYLGDKKLLSVYVLGGITGAGIYILAYSTFPAFAEVRDVAVAYGASAAVSAVVLAMVVYKPDQMVLMMFIGPVKLKYIGIFYVIFDIAQIPFENAGGHIAHLGGAIWGYYYISQLNKGIDRAVWFDKLMNSLFTYFSSRKKLKVTHKRSMTDYEYNSVKRAKQEEIDQILDKIHKSGYSSLSDREKAILFESSAKN